MSKLLVVDDVRSLRLLYTKDLEADGHTVVTAADAIEALRLVESDVPDLVVLDIRMPGMDGIDGMMRMLSRHPRIPIVLNSAYASYKDNFLTWAADAYVTKSSDTGELRETIRRVLDVRRGCSPASLLRSGIRRSSPSVGTRNRGDTAREPPVRDDS